MAKNNIAANYTSILVFSTITYSLICSGIGKEIALKLPFFVNGVIFVIYSLFMIIELVKKYKAGKKRENVNFSVVSDIEVGEREAN